MSARCLFDRVNGVLLFAHLSVRQKLNHASSAHFSSVQLRRSVCALRLKEIFRKKCLYRDRIVVEDLPSGAAEKVSNAAVLERVVDGTANVLPDTERSRVARVHAITTAVPVVL